ncbi:unnamed protein product [Ectocarpus fasciculatus]
MSTGVDDDSDDEATLEEGVPGGNGRKNPAIVPAGDGTGIAAVAGTDNGETAATADGASWVSVGAPPTPAAARVFAHGLSNNSTGGIRRDAVQRGQRDSARGRGGGGGGGGGHGRGVMEVWNFERLARTPLLAAAFEDFSKRALCHESVLFLSEVSRYQNDDYAAPTRDSSGSCSTQFGTFCYITDTFIKAGSPEEVNISDTDKKSILEVYHKGEESFGGVNEEERRMVFAQAYLEVKSMLEANLLRRFLNTDRFKSVRMQRENIQAMMDSPPMQAGVGAV